MGLGELKRAGRVLGNWNRKTEMAPIQEGRRRERIVRLGGTADAWQV